MSIPSRATEAEARKADVAFQVALAQVGAGALEDALTLWEALDPTAAAATAADWLEQAIFLILTRRRLSRDLAMAYYRLIRALRTGTTIRDPFGPPEPEYVTIGTLRREFDLLLADIDTMHGPGGEQVQSESDQQAETLAQDAKTEDAPKGDSKDDSERIPLEDLDDLKDLELQAEADTEKAVEEELKESGLTLYQERVKQIKDDSTVSDARAQEAEQHTAAGVRTARAAEKAVLNGGRGSAFTFASIDRRAIAWARVSLSGDPCYFCAMLIGRGPVYKSSTAATFDGSGDLYHESCHCVAVPMFSTSQFKTDPRYEQSRILGQMWVSGMSLNRWRQLIDEGRESGDAPWISVHPSQTPAQVAG